MSRFQGWLDEEITIGYDDLKVKRRETLNWAEYHIAKEAFEAGWEARRDYDKQEWPFPALQGTSGLISGLTGTKVAGKIRPTLKRRFGGHMKKAEVGKHYMDVDSGCVYVGVRDSIHQCADGSVALVNMLSGSIYSYDTSFGMACHGEFVEVEVKIHWTKKPVEPESGIYEK